ncbi:MAG: TonB family protein [Magnetococcales bacterium]|nr:TonB family protein [Magnetococcales bacterium]
MVIGLSQLRGSTTTFRFAIALLLAMTLHGLVLFGLDLSYLLPKAKKNQSKPLVIQLIRQSSHQPAARYQTAQPLQPESQVGVLTAALEQPESDGRALKMDSSLHFAAHLSTFSQKNLDLVKKDGKTGREETVDLNSKKIKYSSYFGKIKARIKTGWIYPNIALQKKLEGIVLISFSIDGPGNLLNRTVLSSSGKRILDDAALTAIARAAPFPPIPRGWQLERLNMTTAFEYRLKNQ